MYTVVVTRVLPDLEPNAWQLEAIEEGLSDARQGKLIFGKEVNEWLKSWGSPDEKAPTQWK